MPAPIPDDTSAVMTQRYCPKHRMIDACSSVCHEPQPDLVARLKAKSIWGKFGWEPDEDARAGAHEIERLTRELEVSHAAEVAASEHSRKAFAAAELAEARCRELELEVAQLKRDGWG
jgi:hypothetical protein